jgi:polyferredoxin
MRPRILVYAGILLMVLSAGVLTLLHRDPVKVDVIRDRTPMMASSGDGRVENVYRLQIMNTDETRRSFLISVSGLEQMRLDMRDNPVELPGATQRMVPVRVSAMPGASQHGSTDIQFHIEARPAGEAGGAPVTLEERARFVVP